MNGRSASEKAIGASASSMNGRRRPSGSWVASLSGPTNSGMKKANTPSAASTRPMSVRESVNSERRGGRYAATVVIDQARPKAPRPRDQMSPRTGCSKDSSTVRGTRRSEARLGSAASDPEQGGKGEQRRERVGARAAPVAVDEIGLHPERASALDVVLRRVADHH